MNEFTFSCPSCGQPISAEPNSAGGKTTCPACQKVIAIPSPEVTAAPPPAAPPQAPPAPPPTADSPPPLPRSPVLPPAPGQQQTSGLAIASLICSIGSFICIPFGFIPGIICGHMARRRIGENPSLGGSGLATAGLIIGYISLGLSVLALIIVTIALVFFTSATMGALRSLSNPPPSPSIQQDSGTTVENPDTNSVSGTLPDGSSWTLDLADVTIPDQPVSGRVHGQPFALEKTELQGGWLKFEQGKDFLADLEMDVVLFQQDLPGKQFKVDSNAGFGMNPHVYVHWKDGNGRPAQKTFMKGYALRLEFGQPQGGKLPGKIYLCAPDPEKSFIRGSFEVPWKE